MLIPTPDPTPLNASAAHMTDAETYANDHYEHVDDNPVPVHYGYPEYNRVSAYDYQPAPPVPDVTSPLLRPRLKQRRRLRLC